MTSKSEKEVVYLPGGNGAEPGAEQELLPALDDMTPREIVLELDKYIVGQAAAKRAVAVALRNRVRRQKLPPEIAEDVLPKNILMIGPTGVGKTEIARRLPRLPRPEVQKLRLPRSANRRSARAKNSAHNSAKASWTSAWWISRSASAPCLRSKSSPIRASRRWTSARFRTCSPACSASKRKSAK